MADDYERGDHTIVLHGEDRAHLNRKKIMDLQFYNIPDPKEYSNDGSENFYYSSDGDDISLYLKSIRSSQNDDF